MFIKQVLDTCLQLLVIVDSTLADSGFTVDVGLMAIKSIDW